MVWMVCVVRVEVSKAMYKTVSEQVSKKERERERNLKFIECWFVGLFLKISKGKEYNNSSILGRPWQRSNLFHIFFYFQTTHKQKKCLKNKKLVFHSLRVLGYIYKLFCSLLKIIIIIIIMLLVFYLYFLWHNELCIILKFVLKT